MQVAQDKQVVLGLRGLAGIGRWAAATLSRLLSKD